MRVRVTGAWAVPALALALCLLPGAPRTAGARDADPLADTLARLVRDAALGDRVGVSVVEVPTGRVLYRHHAEQPLNPASNMKLVTAAAALLELGADFRMLTGLHGRVEPDGTVPELVVRGFGDPTLRMSDLVELAEQLADRGVRRVGRVVVDGRYFDDQILPPAFEQQPDEVAAFRAPVGALAVERSAFTLRVLPGTSVGQPARVRLAAEGYFDVDNAITTRDGGGPDVVAIQRGDGLRMKLLLRGGVPTGILGVGYRRRVENPLAFAGWAMVDALGRAGIGGAREVALGEGRDKWPLLTARRSAPLSQILDDLGKHSDNFVAEMLLKVMAAERAPPGTSAKGATILAEHLARAGVPEGKATIVNGSGLFVGNAIAADHLTRLLVAMFRNQAVRSEYLSHLAVGGVDGTLHRRLGDLPAARIVRAKTGTLADAIGLSGYILGPEAGHAIAFSVLANGVRGKVGAARNMADEVARACAAHLWKRQATP
jgi:serine-type D-Ala-D-Ala carboxypeptidase/endopeptidase (penicillin-binding protein 4)